MGTYYSVVGGGGTGGRARVRAGGREEGGRTLPGGAEGLGAARIAWVRLDPAPRQQRTEGSSQSPGALREERQRRVGKCACTRGRVRGYGASGRAPLLCGVFFLSFFFWPFGRFGACVVCARFACVMRSPRVREGCGRAKGAACTRGARARLMHALHVRACRGARALCKLCCASSPVRACVCAGACTVLVVRAQCAGCACIAQPVCVMEH